MQWIIEMRNSMISPINRQGVLNQIICSNRKKIESIDK